MSKLQSMGRVAAIFSVLGLVACGGGDGDGAGPDASGGIDASATDCGVVAALGDLGALVGEAGGGPQSDAMPDGPQVLQGIAVLGEGEPFDGVRFELYDNFGAFTGAAAAPGTYELTGDDADYATCGVCFLIDVDIVTMPEVSQARTVFANAGTVTVTSVAGSLEWSASNLSLIEIGDAPAFTPVAGGCTTTIDGVSFSGTIAPPGG